MSALGKREKWVTRSYYRNRTTSNSRMVCREVYRGTPQERRDKQRKDNQRIGEQMEFNTTAKMLTLKTMVESFYFVANAGSSGSVADASNLSAVSIAVARNQYAPSKTTVKFIDKRTMQEKEKIVPSLELWLADGRRKQADYLTWNPNGALICEPPEKVGQSAFNSWCGLIKPKYGDYFIANIEERQRLVHGWNDHLAYLIPHDNERHKFEQWVAHILQRPGDKVETGWCFIATNTGIGRNWLGAVLSKVLRGYVLNNAVLDSVLEGSYNGRMSRKLIMIIDEARAGMRGSNSWALAEKLKTMVNPEYREINEKFGLQWVERNVMRWLVFSNNWDALPIEQNDRRWNFVENPTQPKSTEHYQGMYDQTLNLHFIAAVWAHLTTLPLAGFNVGDRPIENNARARMLANLASEEELALKEFKERWPAQVARWSKVEQFVRDRMPGKPINQTALKRNLAKANMIYVSERVGKGNERLIIVRDLQETDVMKSPQHWINVAIDAAAQFDFDPSSGRRPGGAP
jgi:hypothetical protein